MKVSVFVIIQQENQFLLIRESNPAWKNKWFLPGGKLQDDESFSDAGIREVKEEAGYDISINGITLVRINKNDLTKKGCRIFLSGRVIEGDIKTQYDEHSMEAKWFTTEEMQMLEFRENIADLILKHILDLATIPTSMLELSAGM